MENSYVLSFLGNSKIDPHKSIAYVFIFDGDSNVQLSGNNLKIYYPKISVMREFENSVSLFFRDVSKIPVVNKIIIAHKTIYNLFGSGVYHKPNSIFKSNHINFIIVTVVYLVAMIPG